MQVKMHGAAQVGYLLMKKFHSDEKMIFWRYICLYGRQKAHAVCDQSDIGGKEKKGC